MQFPPGSCPVEEGEELVYGIDLPVEAYYPPIEILARSEHSA